MPRFTKGAIAPIHTNKTAEDHILGVFYTPDVIARHAINDVASRLVSACSTEREIFSLKIVDPSFGDGIFLRVVQEKIAGRLAEIRSRKPRLVNSAKLMDLCMSEVRQECLHGVDINPASEHFQPKLSNKNLRTGCNSLLGTWFPSKVGDRNRLRTIANSPGRESSSSSVADVEWTSCLGSKATSKKLHMLADYWLAVELDLLPPGQRVTADWSIFARQFLNGVAVFNEMTERNVGKIAAKYRFFHWQLEYPFLFSRGFDLVCGNPPWEVIETQEAEYPSYLPPSSIYSEYVSTTYDLEHGRRVELAAAFMKLAINITGKKGRLSFLLPQAVHNAKTFESLRKVASKYRTTFNKFDNSTGVFTNLDKRCDFTALTVDFGAKGPFVIASSHFNHVSFQQISISLRADWKRHLTLLSGDSAVVPDLKNQFCGEVVMKILRQCTTVEGLAQGAYDTWNGLNSTTDRSLFKTTASSGTLPLLGGSDIHILSSLCGQTKQKRTLSVSPNDVRGRGYSEVFGKHLWEIERLGWRKISRLDDTRTIISTPISAKTVNIESLWTIAFLEKDVQDWLEFVWATLPYDVLARGIVNSNVSKFILLGLPVPRVDRSTLNKYRAIRGQLRRTEFGSQRYYQFLQAINQLAFDLFGLTRDEQRVLIKAYYNVRHPQIRMLTGHLLVDEKVAS